MLRVNEASICPSSLFLSFSWMADNWRELADMLLFAEEIGASVEVIRVVTPRQHSLFSLPRDQLSAILAELESQNDSVLARLDRNADSWRTALKSVRSQLDELQEIDVDRVQNVFERSSMGKVRRLLETGKFDPDSQKLMIHGSFRDPATGFVIDRRVEMDLSQDGRIVVVGYTTNEEGREFKSLEGSVTRRKK